MVIADTAAAAQDAAELVEVEYRDLPAVVSPEAALASGAPQLHEAAPGNLAFDYEAGNEQAVEEAFKKAAHVTRVKLEVSRVAPNPMELRGCTVSYDPKEDAYHLYVCIQGINMMRKQVVFRHRRSGGQDHRPCAGRRRQLRAAQRRLSGILHADARLERAGQAGAVDIHAARKGS